MEQQKLEEKDFKKEILEYAEAKQVLVNEKALEMLRYKNDFQKIIDKLIKENLFIIDEKNVEKKIIEKKSRIRQQTPEVIVKKSGFKPIAKETEANYRVMEEYDITGQSCSEGKVKDFLNMFRDKYEFLSGLLKNRIGLNPQPLAKLSRISKGNEIDLIVMVSRKWVTKNGHYALEVEDEETNCIALILKDNKQLEDATKKILLDDVIGLKASKISDDMVIIKEICWPDLPQRTFKKSERDLSMAVISDTHIGSKLFLEKEFEKFLNWLNGSFESKKEQEKVGKIKYLFLVGDNIDGIGVYPDQFDELEIKDIYEQYERLTEYLKQIPEYIEVFICPGQHDAVRRADPQPAIPKEFVPELYEMKNMHLIGSPSWVQIEGLKTMVYHGAALHDLYASVNFLSTKEPQKAIAELLRRRDLMPSYGKRNPYVPEKKDFMLIREEPNLYLGGDMHHNGYMQYRGCLIINSGTWQAQTAYQLEQGHIPTPGICPVIELKTGKIRENCFCKEGE